MGPELIVDDIWVSEHHWPTLSPELVMATAHRVCEADATVLVLPGERRVYGLHRATGPEDVRRALAVHGLATGRVAPGWLLGLGSPARF